MIQCFKAVLFDFITIVVINREIQSVTHYLCVKCGELLMKVIWQAEMMMVDDQAVI